MRESFIITAWVHVLEYGNMDHKVKSIISIKNFSSPMQSSNNDSKDMSTKEFNFNIPIG